MLKAVATHKKGSETISGYLVIVNENYGCYVDTEGNFRRSVDDIQDEIDWAKDEWKIYEEIDFPEDKEKNLMNALQYVAEYKNSIQTIED